MNDQIPLYLGIPLAVFLITATIMIATMVIAVWKDYRE
jgi:hypothetical protein